MVNRILVYLSEYLPCVPSHTEFYVKPLTLAATHLYSLCALSGLDASPPSLAFVSWAARFLQPLLTASSNLTNLWPQRVCFYVDVISACEDERGKGRNVQIPSGAHLASSKPTRSVNQHERLFRTGSCKVMPRSITNGYFVIF